MQAGDAFRFAQGEDGHLWIVVSDPRIDSARVLLVNVTTWRPDKDQTCLLNPGDHPAIEHNSVIHYAGSRVHSDEQLNFLENHKRLVLNQPVSPALLHRIRKVRLLLQE